MTLVDRIVREIAVKQAADVERMCEMSLLDPQQRGVLVTLHGWASWTAELSGDVPYGQIHYLQTGTH